MASNKRKTPPGRRVVQQALEIGARIDNPPSPRLVASAFKAELDAQLPLFEALGRVDLAHTLVMAENGIIPANEARELIGALRRLDQYPDDFIADPGKGDLYTNREAWLAGRTAAVAWLGAGRARREAITTAYTIKLREELTGLAEALSDLVRVLIDRSEEYGDFLMPDYTYLQQAQPTTFGHYLLGFAYPVIRDLQRLRGLYPRLNRSPAGCGSSNGSRLPQSRQRLAGLLGFQDLAVHARDAMWPADLQIEIAALLSALLVNLDRLAEDLLIFASDEFAIVELDDGHARASKIMPQKKNPYALTYIRGLANGMLGTLAAAAAMGRTPSGQPDNRLTLYGALPKALADARGAVELFAEVTSLLTVDDVKARAKLDRGFLLATDLAEVLVLECGLPFRDAHRLVGTLVRQHAASGDFGRLTAGELAAVAETLLGRRLELSAKVLDEALNPEAAVASRRQPGGASAEAMAEMLADCRANLAEAAAWLEQCRRLQREAETMLAQSLNLEPESAAKR